MELLAPAGNEKSFYVAVKNGANAIYIGLNEFSARKSAENFGVENLEKYVRYAHLFGVKVYVAVNTVIKNFELDKYFEIVGKAYNLGVDAFIVQDVFMGKELKKVFPEIVLHLSTQAGINNIDGAKLAKENGFSRVILARETALNEIQEIAKFIETEIFIQGAMCSSYSGHCYMSSFIGGNSGNRGYCKQPCRQIYTYSGQGYKDFTGYNLSLADMCQKDNVKLFEDIGVKSLKIEGRMRSSEYVASAIRFYRSIIDSEVIDNSLFSDLKRTYNRGDYTSGYISGVKGDILSNKIQNHKGEFYAKITSFDKRYLYGIKSNVGDCFKIIRNGEEVGNATCESQGIVYKGNIKKGDDLYITKDIALINKLSSIDRKKDVKVNAEIKIGKPIKLSSGEITVQTDYIVEKPKTSKTTREELENNLRKTDVYPFNPVIEIDMDDEVFIPKSIFNGARASLYEKLYNFLTESQSRATNGYEKLQNSQLNNVDRISIISNNFGFNLQGVENVIFTPNDYNDICEFNKFFKDVSSYNINKYLFVPSFYSDKDKQIIMQRLDGFDGIYADGLSGITLASETKKDLYGGIGLNLTNDYDLQKMSSLTDKYALSMELNKAELDKLSGGVFCLGSIRLMELLYCPFGKDCKNCKRSNINYLTDENGRKFTVRRYKISNCRFEVYNCESLVTKYNFQDKIYNFTNFDTDTCDRLLKAKSYDEQIKILEKHTNGNMIRGIK